jgi:hypothetical protein
MAAVWEDGVNAGFESRESSKPAPKRQGWQSYAQRTVPCIYSLQGEKSCACYLGAERVLLFPLASQSFDSTNLRSAEVLSGIGSAHRPRTFPILSSQELTSQTGMVVQATLL